MNKNSIDSSNDLSASFMGPKEDISIEIDNPDVLETEDTDLEAKEHQLTKNGDKPMVAPGQPEFGQDQNQIQASSATEKKTGRQQRRKTAKELAMQSASNSIWCCCECLEKIHLLV